MTIPIAPGPFSFLSDFGQAAQNMGQFYQAEKQRRYERGMGTLATLIQMAQAKIGDPAKIFDPSLNPLFDQAAEDIQPGIFQHMRMPSQGGNLGPVIAGAGQPIAIHPEAQAESMIGAGRLGKEPVGQGPLQSLIRGTTSGKLGPTAAQIYATTGKLPTDAEVAQEEQKQAQAQVGTGVARAQIPYSGRMGQASAIQQIAQPATQRAAQYLAGPMSTARKDNYGLAVPDPSMMMQAVREAQARGEAVDPAEIQAAFREEQQYYDKMRVAFRTADANALRAMATADPLDKDLAVLNARMNVARQTMDQALDNLLPETSLKLKGMDPTPLTQQELDNPVVRDYMRAKQSLQDITRQSDALLGSRPERFPGAATGYHSAVVEASPRYQAYVQALQSGKATPADIEAHVRAGKLSRQDADEILKTAGVAGQKKGPKK